MFCWLNVHCSLFYINVGVFFILCDWILRGNLFKFICMITQQIDITVKIPNPTQPDKPWLLSWEEKWCYDEKYVCMYEKLLWIFFIWSIKIQYWCPNKRLLLGENWTENWKSTKSKVHCYLFIEIWKHDLRFVSPLWIQA